MLENVVGTNFAAGVDRQELSRFDPEDLHVATSRFPGSTAVGRHFSKFNHSITISPGKPTMAFLALSIMPECLPATELTTIFRTWRECPVDLAIMTAELG
jgi:hypothetical protein